MSILLSDEEIVEASRVNMFLPNGELDPDCGYIRGRQQVAQAQLKRVVELLLDNCDDCDHSRPVYHFRLRGDVWQELLKEIE